MRDAVEYDLFLPIVHNDGAAVPEVWIQSVKTELFREFGGLTDFRHSSEGFWNVGGITFKDDILILRILSQDPQRARAYLAELKKHIAIELDQKEVLVVERTVRLI